MGKIQKVKDKSCKDKKGRIMVLSKCAVLAIKKTSFIKQQEASGLLTSLVIKTPLSKISLVRALLF